MIEKWTRTRSLWCIGAFFLWCLVWWCVGVVTRMRPIQSGKRRALAEWMRTDNNNSPFFSPTQYTLYLRYRQSVERRFNQVLQASTARTKHFPLKTLHLLLSNGTVVQAGFVGKHRNVSNNFSVAIQTRILSFVIFFHFASKTTTTTIRFSVSVCAVLLFCERKT